jgi:uncharacterized protein (TIGR03435 family)
MFVEAAFWFHPLVWWIGARLIAERERACDEEVCSQGHDPETYAAGILRVCRLFLESPLPCAAGVTGADLKKRVEQIMMRGDLPSLTRAKKVLLAGAGVATIAVPVVIGMIQVTRLAAQTPAPKITFEAASVKESKGDARGGMELLPGGKLVVRNLPLLFIIQGAYQLSFQSGRVTGGPDWIRSARFDIDATPEPGTIPDSPVKVRNEKIRLMLQALLAERFRLVIHREMKDSPVYVMLVAKGGPKLKKAAVQEAGCATNPSGREDPANCHNWEGGQGRGLHGQAVSMEDLRAGVEGFSDRPVVNKTGLKDLYNIQTEGWVPLNARPPRPPGQEASDEDRAFADPTRPTIFAIFNGLGLRLESQRAPVEVLVIDSAEKPAEN